MSRHDIVYYDVCADVYAVTVYAEFVSPMSGRHVTKYANMRQRMIYAERYLMFTQIFGRLRRSCYAADVCATK